MEFYKVNSVEEITGEVILKLMERYKLKEVPRIKRLHNYYIGNSDIKNRVMEDETKPNNKIANPLASYITDTVQGYFLGKPVNYSSDNKEYMLKIQDILDNNNEQNHNTKLGKNLSNFAISYELFYMNENSEIKFAMLDAKETFIIYDNSIEKNPLMAVNFIENEDYVTGEITTIVKTFTNDTNTTYKKDEKLGLIKIEEEYHPFNEVPVNAIFNNEEVLGDFERVIDLIDAYDLSVSDTSNNLEYFADAYLMLSGIEDQNLTPEDFKNMKENRVLVFGKDGKGEWLTKSTSDIQAEEYKNRLKEDIHNLSFVPNINDESFGNATSGESLKYKLFALENMVSIKERFFKAGLEKRIKLITNVLNIKNTVANNDPFNPNDIIISFIRNLPSNQLTVSDIKALIGIVPTQTLLSQLPFIEDPAYEIELLKQELEGTLYENFNANNIEE